MQGKRSPVRRILTGMLVAAVVAVGLVPTATAAVTANLAKTLSSSSSTGGYPSTNAGDGNQNTYWESSNNAFPQWIQADLGTTQDVNQITLKLPTGWGARTQTLSIQGSTNGTTF